MVGVPRSRGCLACRQQKKKCNSETQLPPCIRCARLGIECLELGQRRLKFQDETVKFVFDRSKGQQDLLLTSTGGSSAIAITTPSSAYPYNRYQHLLDIGTPPSSALTRLRAGYIRSIDPSADISVHLPWNFGPYLEQVPARLGHNDAFDEAAALLIRGYSTLRTGGRPGQDASCLLEYSKALRALSVVLDQPEQSTQTETVCAINMIMIFESIAGFGSQSILAHAGGAARVFKARGICAPKDEFEEILTLSLRGPVVMQALFLPHAYFTDEEWRLLTSSKIGADSPEEKSFRCLAIFARLLHQATALFEQDVGRGDEQSRLASLIQDFEKLETRHAPELQTLRKQFWQLSSTLNTIGNALLPSRKAGQSLWQVKTYHAHIGRSYGLSISTKVLVNTVLLATRSRLLSESFETRLPREADLKSENENLASEACKLAQEVNQHRPLGTVYMASVLRLVSIGIPDRSQSAPLSIEGRCVSLTQRDSGYMETEHISTRSRTTMNELRQHLQSYMGDFADSRSAEETVITYQALDWLKRRFNLEKDALADMATPFEG